MTPFIERYYSDIIKDAEARCGRALQTATMQYARQYERDIKDIFRKTVKEFYDSYKPTGYHRSESLYNIMGVDILEDGAYISMSFHPELMTGYRNGYKGEDGLYSLVFREGWHGGAAYGDGHPEPGIPHWRAGLHFSGWGRRSARAGTPPLAGFIAAKNKYEDEKAQNVFDVFYYDALRKEGFSV